MPRKAFRDCPEALEALLPYERAPLTLAPRRPRRPRRAFRALEGEDEDGLLFLITAVAASASALLNAALAASLGGLLGPVSLWQLPVDFVAESVYLISAAAVAAFIDSKALLAMFLDSRVRLLNCSAAMGTILAVLKLSLVKEVPVSESLWPSLTLASHLASGELQLNPLIRLGTRVESVYGSTCCMYLATYFAMKVLHNEEFRIDRAAKKLAAYAVSGVAFSIFSGLFTVPSTLGWLVVLHALLVAWTVAQCRYHAAAPAQSKSG